MYIQANFNWCDPLNPGFGYELRIENAETGEPLLFTSRRPDTGADLLTAADCIAVINMYTISNIYRPGNVF